MKIDKYDKNEKSSQFMLLNNDNTFNYLKEINKERNISNNFYDNEKKGKEINNEEIEINDFQIYSNNKDNIIEKKEIKNEKNFLKKFLLLKMKKKKKRIIVKLKKILLIKKQMMKVKI